MRRLSTRFEIIFVPPVEGPPVVVHSTSNADDATLRFAVELQRLLADRAGGELAIRRKSSRSAKPDVVVRQELS
ncbi:MAG: hypothetical protein M3Z20_19760 [Chloroflexota bacterium]|nr:hypothetical protein [Chloroflexota bacterium]